MKRRVKKRFRLSRLFDNSVGDPSGLTRLSTNWDSVIVQPKF